MKNGNKIKVGFFRSGSHLRVVGELDLITQDNGHKDEAIYLMETTVIRDPREEITQDVMDGFIKAFKIDFETLSRFNFKAKDRADAEKFIAHSISTWDVVADFKEV